MTVRQVYEQQLMSLFDTRGKAKHRTRRVAAGFSATTGQHYRAVFDVETRQLEVVALTSHANRGATSQVGPIAETDDTLPEDIAWRAIDE